MKELRAAAAELGIKIPRSGKKAAVQRIYEARKEKSSAGKASSLIDSLDPLAGEPLDSSAAELIDDNETVKVRSITRGALVYSPPGSAAPLIWSEIGAVKEMSVREIEEMNSVSGKYLASPLVILLDDRAVKRFGLEELYSRVARIDKLGSLFRKDEKVISEEIDRLASDNLRELLITKASSMYRSKELTDINIIKLLERKLCFGITEDSDADDVQTAL